MAKRLTKKQKGFVKDYLDTGNATLAVHNHYDVKNDATARVIGSENLTKPNIKQYLEDKANDAVETIYKISQYGESDQVKLSASKDILDRAGYGAVEKSQSIRLNVETKSNDTNTDAENLRLEYEEKLKKTLYESK